MGDISVQTLSDSIAAADAAAEHIASAIRRAVSTNGRATVAFSGGRTPERMLRTLASSPLPWHSISIFQVDERIAPDGHTDRNLSGLHEALKRGHADALHTLVAMPVTATDLDGACHVYQREIEAAAGTPAEFDIIHLGLGDDGHTASLFPGDALLDRHDVDVAVTDGEHAGYRRMTLTIDAIERAREVVFLVSGADKSAALARLRNADPSIPAGRLKLRKAVVFTDKSANP